MAILTNFLSYSRGLVAMFWAVVHGLNRGFVLPGEETSGSYRDKKGAALAIRYEDSGVSIETGDSLVDWLKKSTPSNQPFEEHLVSGIGGFSAIMRAPFKGMERPCLVSATDGVGTKLKLAIHGKRYGGLGQDLVAMCVNDLVCCGAQPLFFLDYFSTGKLDLDMAKEFLGGVRKACIDSQCLLIGGETAEMPGVYDAEDFDCAGFAVGVVDEGKILGRHRVKSGDRIIGVSSSGFHSNGYSLLRKLFAEDMDTYVDALLEPTHLYVSLVGDLVQQEKLNAVAHITGGGIDNLMRVIPKEMGVELKQWDFPELFLEAQKRSGLTGIEMMKTFNCGIGLMLITPDSYGASIVASVKEKGFEAYNLGYVQEGSHEINFIDD